MSVNVGQLFQLLSQYEKESTDSMDWAEYGFLEINHLIADFTLKDWKFLEKIWLEKSAPIMRLLANHIYIDEKKFAEIQLKILKDMIFDPNEDVVWEATRHLIFHFVTEGVSYENEKRHEFEKIEFKKFFLLPESKKIIEAFIDKNLLDRIEFINSKYFHGPAFRANQVFLDFFRK